MTEPPEDVDEDASTDGDATARSTTSIVASPDLEVTLPDEEPTAAGFKVVEPGSGPTIEAGDTVLAAWEMVAFDTGEVVESTADDFGGPVPITVGQGNVPEALDEALIGLTVGTQLEVLFPVGMPDLPAYFDDTKAYVLTVQIVEIADGFDDRPDNDDEGDAAAQPTPTTGGEPATTVPRDVSTGLVPIGGPLSAQPEIGTPLPTSNSHDVIAVGDGAIVDEGDTVEISYVVVSWTTGEAVLSTADAFGGPQSIVLGDRTVPRLMEGAIFGEAVGSRIQIVYSPDLPDLPDGLDRDDAFVVALDIVGLG